MTIKQTTAGTDETSRDVTKEAVQAVTDETSKAVTDETSQAVTKKTGQAVTITLDQVDVKETTTSMAVTIYSIYDNDNRVTESSNKEGTNSGSILTGSLEEGIKKIHEISKNEEEIMSGRDLIGSAETVRLGEGGRMDEGGGGGGRRIRSLESELKRNITGIKQTNSKKFISNKDTSTGKVRKLILGFETMVVNDADLKLKSHESNFKISIENSYQSPEKRRKTVEGSIPSPRHTGCIGRKHTNHLCYAPHPVGVERVC